MTRVILLLELLVGRQLGTRTMGLKAYFRVPNRALPLS
jgi:hypothetical protein